jgi:HD-like signal output (HDOD) protein
LEIIRLARSPDCSLVELARLVEADPAIAGRMLH